MDQNSLLVILGSQLFPVQELKMAQSKNVFMAEDLGLCTYEKHHKLKILMVLTAMREKRDELKKYGFSVDYLDTDHPKFSDPFEEKLNDYLDNNDVSNIKMFEVEDKVFEKRLKVFAEKKKVPLLFLPSPMFLLKRYECLGLVKTPKNLRMGNFYKEVRKKLDILLENNQKPVGGRWSFDAENRKKLPKGLTPAPINKPKQSEYSSNLKCQNYK